MSEVSIVVRSTEDPQGAQRTVETGSSCADLFAGDASIVVARVNGELRDLSHAVADGDVVEPVPVSSDEGLAVLRHSCAHVLAQAVQEIFPAAKLGIGPPIKDGFYYDFDVETPFTPEDLKALEKVMQRDRQGGPDLLAAGWSATTRRAPSWPTSRTSWS